MKKGTFSKALDAVGQETTATNNQLSSWVLGERKGEFTIRLVSLWGQPTVGLTKGDVRRGIYLSVGIYSSYGKIVTLEKGYS